MTLIEDAKNVLLKSWSSRLGFISAVAGILAQFQDSLPLIRDFVPANAFAVLAIVCALSVTVARIVKQDNLAGSGDGQPKELA
jgi:hypothetical protein